jgi:signal transduction histidine kinase
MKNLINDLLDAAKIENLAFTLNNNYFNLVETIQEAFSIIHFQAEQKNISLILELNESVPFIFRKVFSDRQRLLQILQNFLGNSLKFTK